MHGICSISTTLLYVIIKCYNIFHIQPQLPQPTHTHIHTHTHTHEDDTINPRTCCFDFQYLMDSDQSNNIHFYFRQPLETKAVALRQCQQQELTLSLCNPCRASLSEIDHLSLGVLGCRQIKACHYCYLSYS